MGFFSAILEAIAKNYIFFQVVTIFLILSFIGYIVDKKTRKGADITPIFGGKVSLNIKHKDPSAKKGKKQKEFSSTIVGEQTSTQGLNNVLGQNAIVSNVQYDQNAQMQNAYYNNNQVYNQNYYNVDNTTQYQQYNQYNQYDNVAPVPQENYAMNNAYQTPTNEFAVPAATTAQISETILPNVATTPVQAQVQGVSTAAPAMETIVPSVQSEISTPPVQSEFTTDTEEANDNGNDDNGAMNFNMNE